MTLNGGRRFNFYFFFFSLASQHPFFGWLFFIVPSYQGRPVVLTMKLPALLHKFLQPLGSALNSDMFFQKWNQLGGPPREVRQVVKAKEPVDVAAMRKKVGAGPKRQNSARKSSFCCSKKGFNIYCDSLISDHHPFCS